MYKRIELGKRKEKRLNELKQQIDDLFDVNIEMIDLTKQFLESSDNELALKVIDLESRTDQMQQEIVVSVNSILITEQPKASDLRFTLGAFVIAGELEIIGDYLKKFAKNMLKTELTERKHQKLVASLIESSKNDMSETKIAFDQLSHNLASSIARRSEEREITIKKFTDDINELLVSANTYDDVKALTRTLSMSKNFDRTFAHLMLICEQISYIANGQIFHYN